MKYCSTCKENKELSDFANNATREDGLQGFCRACSKRYAAKRYQRIKGQFQERNRAIRDRNRRIAYEYLKDHPCVDCGIKDTRVLTFDHVRGVKAGNVSDMVKNSWGFQTIMDEIAKCEVRCFNCHMIKDMPRSSGGERGLKSWRGLQIGLPSQAPHTSVTS